MGYQESFIKFRDQKTLIEQLKRYSRRDKTNDLAEIVCVDRVKKDILPFREGELVAVVCGERSEQRNRSRLREGLGITKIQDVVFIDNPYYWEMAVERSSDLSEVLREHFERLSDEQYEKLLRDI